MQIPQVGPPLACPFFGHADGYRHVTGKTRHEPRYTPAASVTLEETRCKLLLSIEKTPLAGAEKASATLRSAEELRRMSESLPSLMPRLDPKASTSRLERVAWRAGTCVEAHGVRLGLRTNAPS